jgi:hypothetical protein
MIPYVFPGHIAALTRRRRTIPYVFPGRTAALTGAAA